MRVVHTESTIIYQFRFAVGWVVVVFGGNTRIHSYDFNWNGYHVSITVNKRLLSFCGLKFLDRT